MKKSINELDVGIEAMENLRMGTNTNLVDVLTNPLYSTIALATGTKEFSPFSLSRADQGNNLATTNVQQGNRVPSKQAWDIKAIKMSIVSPVALDDAGIQALNNFLFESVLTLDIDDSPKFEKTLSSILGNAVMVQPVSAVGSNAHNSTFVGSFKLDEKIYMGAETQFQFTVKNYQTAGVVAGLDGVKIRLELDRKLIRLV